MNNAKKTILSISLDTSIALGDLSASGLRQLRYAKYFENYVIILISTKTEHLKTEYHFGNLHIYPTNVIFKPYAILRGLSLVKKFHEQYHFDLMTAQDPLATGMIAAMAKRLLQIPINIQMHSTYHYAPGWEDEAWTHMLWKRLIKPVLRRADSIRVVSRLLVYQLKQDYPNIANKIAHIPVMVDLNFFYRKIKKKSNLYKLITVGRLAPEKNHLLLIQAFAKVNELKPNTHLTIVGHGEMKEFLKYKIKELRLSGSITLVGKADAEQVKDLLADSDIYVSSSNYEGWGNAIIEAMITGLPVVATRVGCLSDGWLGKDIAKTVEINNVQSLAESMLWCMLNPESAQAMASIAQEAVLQKLDNKVLENQWIELLQKTA